MDLHVLVLLLVATDFLEASNMFMFVITLVGTISLARFSPFIRMMSEQSDHRIPLNPRITVACCQHALRSPGPAGMAWALSFSGVRVRVWDSFLAVAPPSSPLRVRAFRLCFQPGSGLHIWQFAQDPGSQGMGLNQKG